MSTITLQNFRVGSDLTVKVRLKDGGVAIDWSTLSGIRAVLYSDAQSSIAGRCDVTVDGEDPTLLVCRYAATKMQYLGVNRIVVSAKYMGETKTYDKPAFTFVRWTADQEGEQITIEDPEVTVEIDVEDVSSSILQEAVNAAFSAADRANEAAEAAEHMVDIKTGPAGKSPYKGENGNWFEWDEEAGQYVDTGVRAKGETGDTPDISIGTVTTVEPGEPAAASMSGTPEAPVLNLSIPKGAVGSTPNISIGTVTTGAPGTPVVITITGTAEAPVLNITIPQGMKGDTGVSADYPITIYNGLDSDATDAALAAAQGKVLDGKISQLQQEVADLLMDIGLADVNIDIHYSVTNNLSNCTTDNDDTSASLGEQYEATITPDEGYDLSSVAVLMGNEDITEDVYDGEGGISIPAVEGDITITAIAVEHGVTVVTFADPIVEQIAYAQGWDDNGVFTTDSLAAVTRIDTVFREAGMSTFDEFRYFTGIRSNLNQLAMGAFSKNPNLESIILPEGIDFYGTNIFANCPKLTSIVIPNSVLSIPSSTFRYCTGLTSIDLGSGITSIGNLWVGNSDNALKTLICRAATPPTSDWSLFNSTALEHIYVPAASVDAYKAATNWSSKASIIEAIPE